MAYSFRYPKDKFFINDDPDNTVAPVIEPAELKGFFTAKPGGLEIDYETGVIDINQSHTGIRYRVTFTPCTDDKPSHFDLVISGVDYVDNVFYLDDKPENLIIRPFLDGDVRNDRELPATIYDLPDRKQLTASYFKLAIDTNTGEIDLRKTIKNCALGVGQFSLKLRPANGACKDFSINYQPQGEKAINNTTIRLHYFNSPNDVPDFLLNRINKNRVLLGLEPVELPKRFVKRGALNIFMEGDGRRPSGQILLPTK
jgi:hypothetical protein